MFHPTHIFPYIDSFTGFCVWALVLLNALAPGLVVATVLRDPSEPACRHAVASEIAITFNVAIAALLLLNPSLMSSATTGSGWYMFLWFLLWYCIFKFVLVVNARLTFKVIFSHLNALSS